MFFKAFKFFVLLAMGAVLASCPGLGIKVAFDTEGPKLLPAQDQMLPGVLGYGLRFDEPIKLSDLTKTVLITMPPSSSGTNGSSDQSVNSDVMVDSDDSSRLIIIFSSHDPQVGETFVFKIPAAYLTDEADNPNGEVSHTVTVGKEAAPYSDFATMMANKSIPNPYALGLSTYSSFTRSVLGGYAGYDVGEVVYVTEQGTGTEDGSSWDNAAAGSVLKDKLDGLAAPGTNEVSFLLVGQGTYDTAALKMQNRVAIVGGWNDGWNRPDTATATATATNTTIFNGSDTHRVFDNSYTDAVPLTGTALLHSVTVQGGNAGTMNGGGMYNAYSSPTLIDVTFSGNKVDGSDGRGGGMYNAYSSPHLINVTFSGNKADGSNGRGGGMFNDNSSPHLINVTFSGNTTGYRGGGMFNDNSSPLLRNVTFSSNTVTGGGGGMLNSYSFPILASVTFFQNEAQHGGGMYNDNSSPHLRDVTFLGNKADGSDGRGGGMFNDNSSPLLRNVTFSSNTVTGGGGGMLNSYSFPILASVTFFQNEAQHGGGMYNQFSAPTLINVTFSSNTADKGGGMYNNNNGDVGPTVINSLFWGNKKKAGSSTLDQQIYMKNDSNGGDENIILYNCIVQHGLAYDGTGGIGRFADPANITDAIRIESGSISITDPLLATALSYDDGYVQTHALLNGSPAIDAGLFVMINLEGDGTLYYSTDRTDWVTNPADPSTTISLPNGAVELTDMDARGRSRDTVPDIGAYERE